MRLLVHVEGQTEETFVNQVLASHLLSYGYYSVVPRIVGNARMKGGIRPWPNVRKDIVNHLNEDPSCIATTMVDYYALPQNWPGRLEARNLPLSSRADSVELALLEDVRAEFARPARFLPFVLMHEFEALLFSDCRLLSRGIGREDLESEFQAVRDQFNNPEEINDSPETAPSKRIIRIFPASQKPLHGNLAILEIGVLKIRSKCPHFDHWLTRIESIPAQTA